MEFIKDKQARLNDDDLRARERERFDDAALQLEGFGQAARAVVDDLSSAVRDGAQAIAAQLQTDGFHDDPLRPAQASASADAARRPPDGFAPATSAPSPRNATLARSLFEQVAGQSPAPQVAVERRAEALRAPQDARRAVEGAFARVEQHALAPLEKIQSKGRALLTNIDDAMAHLRHTVAGAATAGLEGTLAPAVTSIQASLEQLMADHPLDEKVSALRGQFDAVLANVQGMASATAGHVMHAVGVHAAQDVAEGSGPGATPTGQAPPVGQASASRQTPAGQVTSAELGPVGGSPAPVVGKPPPPMSVAEMREFFGDPSPGEAALQGAAQRVGSGAERGVVAVQPQPGAPVVGTPPPPMTREELRQFMEDDARASYYREGPNGIYKHTPVVGTPPPAMTLTELREMFGDNDPATEVLNQGLQGIGQAVATRAPEGTEAQRPATREGAAASASRDTGKHVVGKPPPPMTVAELREFFGDPEPAQHAITRMASGIADAVADQRVAGGQRTSGVATERLPLEVAHGGPTAVPLSPMAGAEPPVVGTPPPQPTREELDAFFADEKAPTTAAPIREARSSAPAVRAPVDAAASAAPLALVPMPAAPEMPATAATLTQPSFEIRGQAQEQTPPALDADAMVNQLAPIFDGAAKAPQAAAKVAQVTARIADKVAPHLANARQPATSSAVQAPGATPAAATPPRAAQLAPLPVKPQVAARQGIASSTPNPAAATPLAAPLPHVVAPLPSATAPRVAAAPVAPKVDTQQAAAPKTVNVTAPAPVIPTVVRPSGDRPPSPSGMVPASASLAPDRTAAQTSLTQEATRKAEVATRAQAQTAASIAPLPGQRDHVAKQVTAPIAPTVTRSHTQAQEVQQQATQRGAQLTTQAQAQHATTQANATKPVIASAPLVMPNTLAAPLVQAASNPAAVPTPAPVVLRVAPVVVEPSAFAALDAQVGQAAAQPLHVVAPTSAQERASNQYQAAHSQAQAIAEVQAPPLQAASRVAPATNEKRSGVPSRETAIATIEQQALAQLNAQAPGAVQRAGATLAADAAAAAQRSQQQATQQGAQKAQATQQQLQQVTAQAPKQPGATAAAEAQKAVAAQQVAATEAQRQANADVAHAHAAAQSEHGAAVAAKGTAVAAAQAEHAAAQATIAGNAQARRTELQADEAHARAAAEQQLTADQAAARASAQQASQAAQARMMQEHARLTAEAGVRRAAAEAENRAAVAAVNAEGETAMAAQQAQMQSQVASTQAEMAAAVAQAEAAGQSEVAALTAEGEKGYAEAVSQGQREADAVKARAERDAAAKEQQARAEQSRDRDSVVGRAADWVKERASSLMDAARQALAQARDAIVGIMERARARAVAILQQARQRAQAALTRAKQRVSGIIASATEAVQRTIARAAAAMRAVIASVQQRLQALVQQLTTMLTAIGQGLQAALNAVVAGLGDAMAKVGQQLWAEVQAATARFRATVEAAVVAVRQGAAQLAQWASQQIDRAIARARELIAYAEQSLMATVARIRTTLTQAVARAQQLGQAVIDRAFAAAVAAKEAAFRAATNAVRAFIDLQAGALALAERAMHAVGDFVTAAADRVLAFCADTAKAVTAMLPAAVLKGFIDFWNGPWRQAVIIGVAVIAAVTLTAVTGGLGGPLAVMLVAGVVGGSIAGTAYFAGELLAREGAINLSEGNFRDATAEDKAASGQRVYIPNFGMATIGPDGKPQVLGPDGKPKQFSPEEQAEFDRQSKWALSSFNLQRDEAGNVVGVEGKASHEIGAEAFKEGVRGFGEGFVAAAMAAGPGALMGTMAGPISSIANPVTRVVVQTLAERSLRAGFDIGSSGFGAAWTAGVDAAREGKDPWAATQAAAKAAFDTMTDPQVAVTAVVGSIMPGANNTAAAQALKDALKSQVAAGAISATREVVLETGMQQSAASVGAFVKAYQEASKTGMQPTEAFAKGLDAAKGEWAADKLGMAAMTNAMGVGAGKLAQGRAQLDAAPSEGAGSQVAAAGATGQATPPGQAASAPGPSRAQGIADLPPAAHAADGPNPAAPSRADAATSAPAAAMVAPHSATTPTATATAAGPTTSSVQPSVGAGPAPLTPARSQPAAPHPAAATPDDTFASLLQREHRPSELGATPARPNAPAPVDTPEVRAARTQERLTALAPEARQHMADNAFALRDRLDAADAAHTQALLRGNELERAMAESNLALARSDYELAEAALHKVHTDASNEIAALDRTIETQLALVANPNSPRVQALEYDQKYAWVESVDPHDLGPTRRREWETAKKARQEQLSEAYRLKREIETNARASVEAALTRMRDLAPRVDGLGHNANLIGARNVDASVAAGTANAETVVQGMGHRAMQGSTQWNDRFATLQKAAETKLSTPFKKWEMPPPAAATHGASTLDDLLNRPSSQQQHADDFADLMNRPLRSADEAAPAPVRDATTREAAPLRSDLDGAAPRRAHDPVDTTTLPRDAAGVPLRAGGNDSTHPATYGGDAAAAPRAPLQRVPDELLRSQTWELPPGTNGLDRGGLAILDINDPHLRVASDPAQRVPGWFDVVVHGTDVGETRATFSVHKRDPQTGQMKTFELTAEQLGALVRDSNWRSGMPVRLFACRGGRLMPGGTSAAAELSRVLKTDVITSNQLNVDTQRGFQAYPHGSDKKEPTRYDLIQPEGSTLRLNDDMTPQDIAAGRNAPSSGASGADTRQPLVTAAMASEHPEMLAQYQQRIAELDKISPPEAARMRAGMRVSETWHDVHKRWNAVPSEQRKRIDAILRGEDPAAKPAPQPVPQGAEHTAARTTPTDSPAHQEPATATPLPQRVELGTETASKLRSMGLQDADLVDVRRALKGLDAADAAKFVDKLANAPEADVVRLVNGLIAAGNATQSLPAAAKRWLADADRAAPPRIDAEGAQSPGAKSTDADGANAKAREPVTEIDPNAAKYEADGAKIFPELKKFAKSNTPQIQAINKAIEEGRIKVQLVPSSPDKPLAAFIAPSSPDGVPILMICNEGRTPATRERMAESLYHEGTHYLQFLRSGAKTDVEFERQYFKNYYVMEAEAELSGRSIRNAPTPERTAAVKEWVRDSYEGRQFGDQEFAPIPERFFEQPGVNTPISNQTRAIVDGLAPNQPAKLDPGAKAGVAAYLAERAQAGDGADRFTVFMVRQNQPVMGADGKPLTPGTYVVRSGGTSEPTLPTGAIPVLRDGELTSRADRASTRAAAPANTGATPSTSTFGTSAPTNHLGGGMQLGRSAQLGQPRTAEPSATIGSRGPAAGAAPAPTARPAIVPDAEGFLRAQPDHVLMDVVWREHGVEHTARMTAGEMRTLVARPGVTDADIDAVVPPRAKGATLSPRDRDAVSHLRPYDIVDVELTDPSGARVKQTITVAKLRSLIADGSGTIAVTALRTRILGSDGLQVEDGHGVNMTKDGARSLLQPTGDAFHISVHGTPNGTFSDGKRTLTPREVAERMVDSGYAGGDVILTACHSGATDLPDQLRVELQAVFSSRHITATVGTIAAPTQAVNGRGSVQNGGHWQLFDEPAMTPETKAFLARQEPDVQVQAVWHQDGTEHTGTMSVAQFREIVQQPGVTKADIDAVVQPKARAIGDEAKAFLDAQPDHVEMFVTWREGGLAHTELMTAAEMRKLIARDGVTDADVDAVVPPASAAHDGPDVPRPAAAPTNQLGGGMQLGRNAQLGRRGELPSSHPTNRRDDTPMASIPAPGRRPAIVADAETFLRTQPDHVEMMVVWREHGEEHTARMTAAEMRTLVARPGVTDADIDAVIPGRAPALAAPASARAPSTANDTATPTPAPRGLLHANDTVVPGPGPADRGPHRDPQTVRQMADSVAPSGMRKAVAKGLEVVADAMRMVEIGGEDQDRDGDGKPDHENWFSVNLNQSRLLPLGALQRSGTNLSLAVSQDGVAIDGAHRLGNAGSGTASLMIGQSGTTMSASAETQKGGFGGKLGATATVGTDGQITSDNKVELNYQRGGNQVSVQANVSRAADGSWVETGQAKTTYQRGNTTLTATAQIENNANGIAAKADVAGRVGSVDVSAAGSGKIGADGSLSGSGVAELGRNGNTVRVEGSGELGADGSTASNIGVRAATAGGKQLEASHQTTTNAAGDTTSDSSLAARVGQYSASASHRTSADTLGNETSETQAKVGRGNDALAYSQARRHDADGSESVTHSASGNVGEWNASGEYATQTSGVDGTVTESVKGQVGRGADLAVSGAGSRTTSADGSVTAQSLELSGNYKDARGSYTGSETTGLDGTVTTSHAGSVSHAGRSLEAKRRTTVGTDGATSVDESFAAKAGAFHAEGAHQATRSADGAETEAYSGKLAQQTTDGERMIGGAHRTETTADGATSTTDSLSAQWGDKAAEVHQATSTAADGTATQETRGSVGVGTGDDARRFEAHRKESSNADGSHSVDEGMSGQWRDKKAGFSHTDTQNADGSFNRSGSVSAQVGTGDAAKGLELSHQASQDATGGTSTTTQVDGQYNGSSIHAGRTVRDDGAGGTAAEYEGRVSTKGADGQAREVSANYKDQRNADGTFEQSSAVEGSFDGRSGKFSQSASQDAAGTASQSYTGSLAGPEGELQASLTQTANATTGASSHDATVQGTRGDSQVRVGHRASDDGAGATSSGVEGRLARGDNAAEYDYQTSRGSDGETATHTGKVSGAMGQVTAGHSTHDAADGSSKTSTDVGVSTGHGTMTAGVTRTTDTEGATQTTRTVKANAAHGRGGISYADQDATNAAGDATRSYAVDANVGETSVGGNYSTTQTADGASLENTGVRGTARGQSAQYANAAGQDAQGGTDRAESLTATIAGVEVGPQPTRNGAPVLTNAAPAAPATANAAAPRKRDDETGDGPGQAPADAEEWNLYEDDVTASASASAPVQLKPAEGVSRSNEASAPVDVHAAAARATAGTGERLPYADEISAALGGVDLSYIHVHRDSAAQKGAAAIGASAFASGNAIVLGDKQDKHTVAHEVAHVLQQRAGVSLLGGVGTPGDSYEQNADAIADRVVAGRSAVDLLPATARDRVHPDRGPRVSTHAPVVQMKHGTSVAGHLIMDLLQSIEGAIRAGSRALAARDLYVAERSGELASARMEHLLSVLHVPGWDPSLNDARGRARVVFRRVNEFATQLPSSETCAKLRLALERIETETAFGVVVQPGRPKTAAAVEALGKRLLRSHGARIVTETLQVVVQRANAVASARTGAPLLATAQAIADDLRHAAREAQLLAPNKRPQAGLISETSAALAQFETRAFQLGIGRSEQLQQMRSAEEALRFILGLRVERVVFESAVPTLGVIIDILNHHVEIRDGQGRDLSHPVAHTRHIDPRHHDLLRLWWEVGNAVITTGNGEAGAPIALRANARRVALQRALEKTMPLIHRVNEEADPAEAAPWLGAFYGRVDELHRQIDAEIVDAKTTAWVEASAGRNAAPLEMLKGQLQLDVASQRLITITRQLAGIASRYASNNRNGLADMVNALSGEVPPKLRAQLQGAQSLADAAAHIAAFANGIEGVLALTDSVRRDKNFGDVKAGGSRTVKGASEVTKQALWVVQGAYAGYRAAAIGLLVRAGRSEDARALASKTAVQPSMIKIGLAIGAMNVIHGVVLTAFGNGSERLDGVIEAGSGALNATGGLSRVLMKRAPQIATRLGRFAMRANAASAALLISQMTVKSLGNLAAKSVYGMIQLSFWPAIEALQRRALVVHRRSVELAAALRVAHDPTVEARAMAQKLDTARWALRNEIRGLLVMATERGQTAAGNFPVLREHFAPLVGRTLDTDVALFTTVDELAETVLTCLQDAQYLLDAAVRDSLQRKY